VQTFGWCAPLRHPPGDSPAGERLRPVNGCTSGNGCTGLGPSAWLLVHGLAVSHRYLMPTAAALAGTVYVPDLPGFGLSDKPTTCTTW
jgi:pimeloyl-ACP methyl ester carboxylesterase